MTVEELSGPPVGVWPDNLAAVNLFVVLMTQWRVGVSGVVGLDYNVLYRKMDRMKLTEAEYDDLEDDVRVMETEAMKTMMANTKGE